MQRCYLREDDMKVKSDLMRKYSEQKVYDNGDKIYIGVVFHICLDDYNKNNMKKDVNYSIQTLNKDFNQKCDNFDSGKNIYKNTNNHKIYKKYVALSDSANIQFYKVDILYYKLNSQQNEDFFEYDQKIKEGSQNVEPNKYLNVWIADVKDYLGYAELPWYFSESPKRDGVVIHVDVFGKNPKSFDLNLNKTLTHEVGHWLGLYHIFNASENINGGIIDYKNGDKRQEIQEKKGDCVIDTPPQGKETYGNPYKNPSSWPQSKPSDDKKYKHMFMNFMDYTDDIALFMFTKDQVIKMRQFIYIYRPDILTNSIKTTKLSENDIIENDEDEDDHQGCSFLNFLK